MATELEARFLTKIRQLTFEGRRAGEGYFGKDGRQPRAALRAYLGTVPDYAEEDAMGFLLSSVAICGPAVKRERDTATSSLNLPVVKLKTLTITLTPLKH